MNIHALSLFSRRFSGSRSPKIFNLKDLGRTSPILLQTKPTVVCVIAAGRYADGAKKIFASLCAGLSGLEHVEHESVSDAEGWCLETGHTPVMVIPTSGKGFRPSALTQFSAGLFKENGILNTDWAVSVGVVAGTRYDQCAHQMGIWFGKGWRAPEVSGEGKKSQLVFPWGVGPMGDSLIIS